MIVVTGGAGFIGSNIVKGLNKLGHTEILVVDDLTDGKKFVNLVDCEFYDYMDKDDFIEAVRNNSDFHAQIEVVFHQGACSATTEWDGKFMMKTNFEYSKDLLRYCQEKDIPFIYASSAATYGMGEHGYKEQRECEKPLNMYGFSKVQFDQYVRHILPKSNSPVIGLRYFNVYGSREQHKGSMSSVAFHLNNQIQQEDQTVRLFEGYDGYSDGEQLRDFVYIDDVVSVNLWFWQQHNNELSGFYNVGTGVARPFNEVAQSVIDWHGKGKIKYIPFPDHLRGCYQSYTQADITKLREAGYTQEFTDVKSGVKKYLDCLNHVEIEAEVS